MKKIIKYLAIYTALLMTSISCEGYLDTEPSNGLPSDKAIIDLTSAKYALYGAYDRMQQYDRNDNIKNEQDYYAAVMIYFGSVQGDLMQARISGKRGSNSFEMRYTADNTKDMWSQPYRVIKEVNTLLMRIKLSGFKYDKNDADDVAEFNDIIGQAKFLRALSHFDLVRLYSRPYTLDNGASMGIPIQTKPIIDSEGFTSIVTDRKTVKDVYDFIITELEEAATLMRNEKINGEANYWAAHALLSRVYLYKGDNVKSLEASEKLLEAAAPFGLWTDDEYATEWGNHTASNKEVIFAIANVSQSDWADREAIGYLYSQNGYDDIIFTPVIVNYFINNPKDVRVVATRGIEPGGNVKLLAPYIDSEGKSFKIFCDKFPGVDGDTRYGNVTILRLSEIVLNAAEAAFKSGDVDKAASYLNMISARNEDKAVFTSANILLNDIIEERKIELVGEGHRKFDLLRNDMEINRAEQFGTSTMDPASVKYGNDFHRSILPIPKKEINANKQLADKQNPNY